MAQLYLGRIVAVGLTPEARLTVLYRVSSRSFPNRRAVLSGPVGQTQRAAILPKPGHEADALVNPYIAYSCARLVREGGRDDGRPVAVLTNGSHTDPIAEKILAGQNVRDAFVQVLAAMDYEKDDYNTPRIAAAAVLDGKNAAGWLGVVRQDGLDVRRFALEPGACVHVSTYEHAVIQDGHPAPLPSLDDADAGCRAALAENSGPFGGFSNPVTAVCALAGADCFSLACREAGED